MGSLAQNAAKGTLLAGKGAKAAIGWAILTLVVVKMTLWAGVVVGPAALVIPAFYFAVAGEMALNKTRGALQSAAEGA